MKDPFRETTESYDFEKYTITYPRQDVTFKPLQYVKNNL